MALEWSAIGGRVRKSCGQCGAEIDVTTACARVGEAGVRLYCSAACATQAAHGPPPAPRPVEPIAPARSTRVARGGAVFVIGMVAVANLSIWPGADRAPEPPIEIAELAPAPAPVLDQRLVF